MRVIAAAVLMMCLVPGGLMAQRGQMQMNRRAQLEQRIVQRFMDQSSREIGLDARERGRVEAWLQSSQERRRNLAADAAETRRRLMAAVVDPQTDDATFASLLDEFETIREREHRQWQQDQTELKSLLPPRKRAQMTVRLLRLQETIRSMIEERREPGGGPGGPGVEGADPRAGPVFAPGSRRSGRGRAGSAL